MDEFSATPEKLEIVNFLNHNKTPVSQAGDHLYAKKKSNTIEQGSNQVNISINIRTLLIYFVF